ncbi:orotidine-5'-phosphate decarboxylase [bacterium]|nr:MAG: orotidine-5'-phosphate decarboxylase [bacterium]
MERLIVALDVNTLDDARKIVEELDELVDFYKVGFQLFIREGKDAVKFLKEQGKKVFLDLKFHDIPNTIGNAVRACMELGVDMLTLHSLGGFEMMEVAQKSVWEAQENKPLLLGVTILTSLDEAFLHDVVGVNDRTLEEEVLHLARLVKSAGLDGVVASPLEVKKIKETCGEDFVVVTPGIRPKGYDTHDQERVRTPEEAILAGADYLVVGRPILYAEDRRGMAERIIKEMEEARAKLRGTF